MAHYPGHLQAIEIWDTPQTDLVYIPIGSIRNTSIAIVNDVGDITTKDSAHQREYDPTSFLKSYNITFSGLTNATDGYDDLKLIHQSGTSVAEKFQFTFADTTTVWTGEFSVASFSVDAGAANEPESFTCTLHSNGLVS